ncbi:MAG: DUF397 domain-containing protein [Pseudonocardia sp.]
MANEIQDRRPSTSLAEARWRKSSHSGAVGNCVEIAALSSGEMAFRNSRDPGGPALIFTQAEFVAFLGGAKSGEFDIWDR